MRKIKSILSEYRYYIYDPSVDIQDRTFMLFSVAVLIAIFIAVPCGLVMREPLSATLSTLAGAVFFSIYVFIAFVRKKLARAKIVISFILVFVFLPLMFFSNGGVYGGAPVWLLLGTLYIALILDGRMKNVMLILDLVVMLGCWIVGYYHPELITSYSRGGNYFDTMAALIIVGAIITTMITYQIRMSRTDVKQKSMQRLFDQTATALVNAIDAKDKYTHGHSSRVAEYSRRIAEEAGKSPAECDEIYYIALLHDVGKIGVPESIITKNGKLTDDEYKIIKEHSTKGAQILQSISEYPRLSIGAHHHHERYDGKGYPDHLIGTDIPEIARIISVADAYDAMTSRRSYRDPIPQQQVREEIVKGIGSQFDPEFARIMVHLIDMDIEYEMMERAEIKKQGGKDALYIENYLSAVSDGIWLNPCMTTVHMKIKPDKNGNTAKPCIILFDSLDGRFHDAESEIRDLMYLEYAEIGFDDKYQIIAARDIRIETEPEISSEVKDSDEYVIRALRIKDHALIRIISKEKTSRMIIALPDSSRFAYIGLSGEHCVYTDLKTVKAEEESPEDTIPRIAEEISYINVPAGDVPNVQIDGYRTDATEGIRIVDGMQISFHTCSLPTARLVWHTSFINIFDSDDGKVTGDNYRDLTLMRLDGECWEGHPDCTINLILNRNEDFEGWDAWKEYNKKGFDCTVRFEKKGNQITARTENAGISVKNTSVIEGSSDPIYVSLTGDQVAITNIRITYPEVPQEIKEPDKPA